MSERNSRTRNHCFIYPLKDKEGQPYAWKIDIQRSGKAHVHYFDFAEYGGEIGALEAAEALRNQLVLKMPQSFSYEDRQRLMPHNTSGHPGVYRVQSNQIDYWRATTRIHGYNLSKSFRIDKYGDEQAKQMALDERERQLTLCSDPYDIAMEKLQQHFSQTSKRVRENRIKAAMYKPREQKTAAEVALNSQQERVLPISAEQASLSISRHFAASHK
ncbi:AP2 domain-containing protein [Pseudomonas sp. 7P_10.2_Bac1]|uniref:AP2 domain-containing protein n=1 Tax=Pseudomonas sp. 7P_10.2_Bac1 TaxID=2971614 RepID=UPI0021C568A9|nr:AP2 domain-containing protein [Pseudomonas sp. 7P_10.2_Bac1]MCU1729990.1 AP2 domain-containing protein [Pseudomonas sp. 7P_10.2_Bac1]